MASEESELTPELLTRVHNTIYPWPRADKLDWKRVINREFDNASLFKLLIPVWKNLSQKPLSLPMPPADAPDYLEQCCGLIFIIDQTRTFFQDTDVRYTRAFFDPACEKLALELLNSDHSPYRKETWISRGWSFEDFIARVITLWAPLIHSENLMANHWDTNKEILLYLRQEIEAYTGEKDPHAATQDEDERDLNLFSAMVSSGPAAFDMAGYNFWMLRVLTSHRPITHEFKRYPYVNDMVGRDFAPSEEEWMSKNKSLSGRLDEAVRETIRKDVDTGTWSPLKLDYEYSD
ncbi:MAG: hypothetical protein GOMPHAMPRED_007876 [Gomphillus americanus]|uniref:Uncharacterized protein n=1 Tax=Gomphillus americanus TaxID=1940652 RepID=A0A8H3F2X5_9LECA|nr:MAG: hypothetical protein GOMPHAMPRED_007876 [Gomphillus americanus]